MDFGRDGFRPRTPPPINEGEEHDVKILSLGREGDGIAKVNNFVIVIPNVQVGDYVKIKVNKVARKVAFGEVLETLEEPAEEEAVEESEEVMEIIE